MKRIKQFLVLAGALITLAAIAVAIKVATIDHDGIQNRVQSALNASTGWVWHIDGPTEFKWGLRPGIEISSIAVENIEGGYFPSFLEVEKIGVKSGWFAIVRGQVENPEIIVHGANLFVESNEAGHTNSKAMMTAFGGGPAASDEQNVTIPRSVVFRTSSVIYRSGYREVERRYEIDNIALTISDVDRPVEIAIETLIAERPLAMSGHLGSVAAMTGGASYAIAVDGFYDGEKSDAEVAINGDIATGATTLEMSVSADSLNEIDSISGIKLPRDTPVSIRISAADKGDGLIMEDYILRLGQAIIRPSSL